jgi:hypothetical protein
MSSPRVVKMFEILKENFHNLGYPFPVKNIQGTSTDAAFENGCQGLVMDFDSSTWVTGNRRFVLLAESAGYNFHDAVKTQSHASGTFIDGSSKMILVLEAQAGLSNASTAAELAYGKFQADVLHILRGQLSAPVDVYFCNNTDKPEVEGIDSSTGSSTFLTKLATLLPYGRTYVGGI